MGDDNSDAKAGRMESSGNPPAAALEANRSSGLSGGSSRVVRESDDTGQDKMSNDTNMDAHEAEARLDEAAQTLIGQHLKAVYSEIVQQPVPKELLELLDELERKEQM